MRFLTLATATTLSLLLGGVNAQSPAWGQCGGRGWPGATTCISGYTCTYNNPYYSQCLPGTAPPGTTTTASSPPPSTTSSPPPSTTSSGPTPTGSQIRTVQDPVFHFYLQDNDGKPQLGPEASSGYFTISGTISLNESSGSKLYLNIDDSVSTSYKPLTLDVTAVTTDWGLEGDTIITTSPRQLNFIACPTSDTSFYDIYLQTGNDTPSGAQCTLVTIHLPCLC